MNDEDRKILEDIRAAFGQAAADDERLADFAEKLKNGQIDYADARKYARLIGGITSDALLKFAEEIQAAADGYEPVLETLRDAYENVSGYAEAAQQAENVAGGTGLKAIRPVFNENTASGIAAKASNAETVEETETMLGAPVKNFTEKVVNDTIEENARYQHNAGLHPKVIRSGGRKCCEWCAALSGKFEYGSQPKDFFRQHENCTCMIEFSGDGSKYRVNGKWNKGAGSGQKAEVLKKLKPEGITRKDKINALLSKKELLTRIETGKSNENNRGVIAERILSGEYSVKLKHQKYLQHKKDTPQYENAGKGRKRPQSYLTITEEEAQKIILDYAGTGHAMIDSHNNVRNYEFVNVGRKIGFYPEGDKWVETGRAQLIYARDGAHIVPVKEKDEQM